MIKYCAIFFVRGIPQPKGNLARSPHSMSVYDANKKLKPWMNAIKSEAMLHKPDKLIEDAMWLDCMFVMPRPKSVKRLHHTVKPDRDKLLRAVQDALEGIIYVSDAQVIDGQTTKRYQLPNETPGVQIGIFNVIE